jgi:hypothetical protein
MTTSELTYVKNIKTVVDGSNRKANKQYGEFSEVPAKKSITALHQKVSYTYWYLVGNSILQLNKTNNIKSNADENNI